MLGEMVVDDEDGRFSGEARARDVADDDDDGTLGERGIVEDDDDGMDAGKPLWGQEP